MKLVDFINKLKDYSSEGTVLINGNSNFLIGEKLINGLPIINIITDEANKEKDE